MKTVPMHVRYSTVQIVTLAGKNTLSVNPGENNMLEVVRKRHRGTFYDKQFIPMSRVLAFSSGENSDKEGTAYALVYMEILLKEITGQGVFVSDKIVRIIDEKNITHDINLHSEIPNIHISLIEPKVKEIELEPERSKKKLRSESFVKEPRNDFRKGDPISREKKLDNKKLVRGKRDFNF